MRAEDDRAIRFIRAMLELSRSQAEAIDAGDFETAVAIGRKIESAGEELRRVFTNACTLTADHPLRVEVESAACEMRATHRTMLERLEISRIEMADLLRNLRTGRQVINHYRVGNTSRPHRLSDVA